MIKNLFILFSLVLFSNTFTAAGQVGGVRSRRQVASAEVGAYGDETDTSTKESTIKDLAILLVKRNDYVHPQDAVEIATLIETVRVDPDSTIMLENFRNNPGDDEKLDESKTVLKLKHVLDDIRMMDYVFKDHEKAMRFLFAQGDIEESKHEMYRRNPALLEEDTRQKHYNTFVKTAVAGGYL